MYWKYRESEIHILIFVSRVVARPHPCKVSCSVYAEALHQLDVASDFTLSALDEADKDAKNVSSWAVFEGTVLHDLVAYCHKLSRNSGNANKETIRQLKELCPQKNDPKTRSKKESAAPPEETQRDDDDDDEEEEKLEDEKEATDKKDREEETQENFGEQTAGPSDAQIAETQTDEAMCSQLCWDSDEGSNGFFIFQAPFKK